ncbi:MAG: alpha/beta hydrolase-fold protein [Pigmentiphaga sp.]|nr:alpha/beta hydrolase-fold protein [Pigmentiphaga sp.]
MLHSRGGDAYRVAVSWPAAAPPAAGWPLACLLGDEHFELATALLRHHAGTKRRPPAEPGILVAVGYPGANRRAYDYTPAPQTQSAGDAPAGGADALLDFLIEDLLPGLRGQFPIAPRRTALAGHSLGGLCVLYALLTRPGAFGTYLASSPSVWWDDGYLARAAERHLPREAATGLPPARVLISVGEYEQRLGPADLALSVTEQERLTRHRGGRRMIDGNRDLATRLGQVRGLDVGFELIPGEGHASVVPRALDLGLRLAFAP